MRMRTCAAGLIGLAAVLVLCVVTPAAAHLNGAIWTTAADGDKVNANLYDQKCPPDVDPCVVPPLVPFLNGGPSFASPSRWVPDGDYYFQVTDPSGKVLLSTDDIEARRFRVEQIEIDPGVWVKVTTYPVAGNPAPHIACNDAGYPLWETKTIALCPMDDTPNNGGVYKLWITRVEDYNTEDPHARFGFIPAYCKTDNFKVKGLASIWGDKVDDVGDPVEGLHILLYEEQKVKGQVTWILIDETCTDGNGEFSFTELSAGKYRAVEDLDLSLCDGCGCIDYSDWEPLSPTEIIFNISNADLGGKGKNASPGEPIYIGQFVNRDTIKPVAALEGRKFLDLDGDGCLGVADTPLEGWTICLEMKDGNGGWVQAVHTDETPVDCETTGLGGSYSFADLPVPMTYRISETLKAGWLQTGPNTDPGEMQLYPPDGVDPCSDIDTDPASGDVSVFAFDGRYVVNFEETALLETIVLNLNFGNALAELCVEKRDACTDEPIDGIEFTLWDCACTTQVTEDARGNAINPIVTGGGDDCWDNLLAGDYCVVETPEPGWIAVGPTQRCVTVEAGGSATATFTNWAPSMGLTPGYWKNWRNHYTDAQFCELLQGTIADVGDCAADIAAADLIFEHWDASPDDELTILKAFLLANQLTLNLTQTALPNPSEGSLVPESSIDCYGTPIVLADAIDAALACLGDSCSRDDLLMIKNWLACFAESRLSTPPCLPN